MTTYKSLKTLCESFGMSFYEIPELSDQELNIIPEEASIHGLPTGFPHTEEAKVLIREARARQVFSEETRKRMSESQKGRKHAAETIVKMIEAGKRRIQKPCSEETRKKMSEVRRGKPKSEQMRERLSAATKGKPKPESAKEKLRQYTGEKSSGFGSSWYNDGVKNIKIAKGQEVPDGLIRGRINNWRKV